MTLNVGIHSVSSSACTRDRTEIVMVWCRAVGRSENSGVPVNLKGLICSPTLVEIGLTDLPKSGGAMAPPAPPATTGLWWCAARKLIVSIWGRSRSSLIILSKVSSGSTGGGAAMAVAAAASAAVAVTGEAAREKCLSDHLYSAAYE